jgi:hypothetical protein
MLTLVHALTDRVYLRKWPPGVSSGCPVWRQCPQRGFGLKSPDAEGSQGAKYLALPIECAQGVEQDGFPDAGPEHTQIWETHIPNSGVGQLTLGG